MRKNLLNNQIKSYRLKPVLSLLIAASFGTAVWLAYLPGSGGLIGALSLKRLALLAPPLAAGSVGLFLAIYLKKHPENFRKQLTVICCSILWRISYLLAAVLSLSSWSILFFVHLLSRDINPFINLRILPLTVWVLSLSILFLVLHRNPKTENRNVFSFSTFLIPAAILAIITLLIVFTKSGFYTKDVTVNDLGVPLLEWQIIYVFGIILLLALIRSSLNEKYLEKILSNLQFRRYLSIFLFFTIWFSACLIWVHQPLPKNNYFLPERLPPNFNPYPFSDAERYSLEGLRFLNGSIQNFIIEKPMHTLFLAFVYKIAGLDYYRVILVQTIILSIFSAVLFLIGKAIHGFRLGIGMGMFAIFREVNKILAADIANVSNTKLVMSDFPAMLILAVLVLVSIKWLKKPHRSIFPVLLGGIIGTLSLYRAQYLIFFPLLLFLGFFIINRRQKRYLKFTMAISLALLLTLLPIMVRNWSISGVLWIDDPEQFSALKEHYISPIQPGDSSSSLEKSAGDPEGNTTQPNSFFEYGRDIIDNFSRNLISAFLVFPVRYNGSQTLIELTTLKNFWAEPYSYKYFLNRSLIAINLLLLAAGFAGKGNRLRKINLGLIFFFLVFNFSTALFRFSGWRFIMPMDWFMYIWYLLGFIACLSPLGIRYLETQDPVNKAGATFTCKHLIAIIPFILLSSVIPLRTLFPENFNEYSKDDICHLINKSLPDRFNEEAKESISSFCHSDDSIVDEGKLLHPRYFRRAHGFYDRPEDAFFGIQDYSRLTFRVLGSSPRKYYLPVNWDSNWILPDGVQAVVLTDSHHTSEAFMLILPEYPDVLIISDAFQEKILGQTQNNSDQIHN